MTLVGGAAASAASGWGNAVRTAQAPSQPRPRRPRHTVVVNKLILFCDASALDLRQPLQRARLRCTLGPRSSPIEIHLDPDGDASRWRGALVHVHGPINGDYNWRSDSMNGLMAMMLFQQDSNAANPAAFGMGIGMTIFMVALLVLMIAATWKIFEKAGKPGWAAIVPIYNFIVFLEIAGKPLWWIVLLLIPLVNIVILIMVTISVAKNFGKGVGFALGMVFLSPIFYPMLAWGDAQYHPQAA
jgi:Family of unknown function (DUF5684)